ncbi:MAG: prolipoprotein diacylglyceryl transferase [Gammaproteobacteria bacterium]|nr:prolipoprotein diacylglyceryl transferase [Gammaproteobacteria bacterium]
MYSHFDSNTWVTPFGLIFLVAIFTGWLLARRNAVAMNIDGSHVDLLMPVTIIVGIAGGTLLSLLMPMDQMIAGEMMQTGVRIRLFGMLATGAVAVFIYSRIVKLSFRRLLDVFALPTLAGLMIHRIGCFLAGCCWGDIVSAEHSTSFASQVQTLPFLSGLSSGVSYPPGSLPYQQHLALGLIEPSALASLPVYPVQLYEGALLLVLLLALWRFPWRRYPAGVLAVVVVCAYAFLRFFIEYLRADGHIVLGNMTVTQLQCLFLLLSAILLPGMLGRTRG